MWWGVRPVRADQSEIGIGERVEELPSSGRLGTMTHAETLQAAFALISTGRIADAAKTIEQHYPFIPPTNAGRKYTPFQSLQIFIRDGFCDRYSGKHLINPAVLRLFSAFLPDQFPAHPNWKQSESHIGFWELFPTIDHLVPVARGGPDSPENWVTTSMLRNSAKSNALLEELGWELKPHGDLSIWDGMTGALFGYLNGDPQLKRIPPEGLRHRDYILQWARASKRAWNSSSVA